LTALWSHRKKIDPSGLITHRFTLDDILGAYNLLSRVAAIQAKGDHQCVELARACPTI
jgi:hypothetical protein